MMTTPVKKKASGSNQMNVVSSKTKPSSKHLANDLLKELHGLTEKAATEGLDVPSKVFEVIVKAEETEEIEAQLFQDISEQLKVMSNLVKTRKEKYKDQLLAEFRGNVKSMESGHWNIPPSIHSTLIALENAKIIEDDLIIQVAKDNEVLNKILNPEFQKLGSQLVEELKTEIDKAETSGHEVNLAQKSLLNLLDTGHTLTPKDLEKIRFDIEAVKELNKGQSVKLIEKLKADIVTAANKALKNDHNLPKDVLDLIKNPDFNNDVEKLLKIKRQVNKINNPESVQILSSLIDELKEQVDDALSSGIQVPGEIIPLIQMAEEQGGKLDKSDFSKLFKYNTELKELNKIQHPPHIEQQIELLRDLVEEAGAHKVPLVPERVNSKTGKDNIDPMKLLERCESEKSSMDMYEKLLACNNDLSSRIYKNPPTLLNPLITNTTILVEHALGKGKKIPDDVIEVLGKLKQKQKVDQQLVDKLSNHFEELSRIIAPATLESAQYIHYRKKDINSSPRGKYMSTFPIRRQQLLMFISCIVAFIGLFFYEEAFLSLEDGLLNNFNVGECLIGMAFLASAAGMGTFVIMLPKLNKVYTQYTYEPTHNYTYWLTVFFSILGGVGISEFTGIIEGFFDASQLGIYVAIKLLVAFTSSMFLTKQLLKGKLSTKSTATTTQTKENDDNP